MPSPRLCCPLPDRVAPVFAQVISIPLGWSPLSSCLVVRSPSGDMFKNIIDLTSQGVGSLFTCEGGSQADVNNRIRIGWMQWKASGVMCDRKMTVPLKDKLFKTIIRPAMAYGSECWAVKKKYESKLNSAEMRML